MRFIFDTQILLWALSGSERLSGRARSLLEDISNEPFLSVASLWELAIKASIGKLELDTSFSDFVQRELEPRGVHLLPILPRHLDVLVTLPLHHRDPFDRLIIAQALAEDVPVLTSDRAFAQYGVQLL